MGEMAFVVERAVCVVSRTRIRARGTRSVLGGTTGPLRNRMRASESTMSMSERDVESGREPAADKIEASEDVLLPADSDVTPTLSVIMPTLNEEEGVAECIQRIKRAARKLDVPTEVIVSDSSTDRTPEIARKHGAIVVTPDRRGYGYAYRYGFEHARGDYIAIGDADTTYDFEDLPRLFEQVANGNADMVLGSRLNGEIEPGAMPALHRYVGNPILTKFLNAFYDAGVSDAHSGFRVIEREALNQLKLRGNGMEFASEMVMKASVQGLNINEVPITYHTRLGEAKLNSFHDGWRHVRFMLVNAPGYIFTVPAVLFIGIGLLLLGSALVEGGSTGLTLGLRTAVVGCLLTIIGYQIGTLAVFSTIAGDPIRAPRDPLTRWIAQDPRLEYGVTAGSLLFIIGSVSTLYLVVEGTELSSPPPIAFSMAAFTAIVIGLQTVFSSFFFGLLDDYRRHELDQSLMDSKFSS
jgi:glycosyltransferase involved in cell wall biosynthesis